MPLWGVNAIVGGVNAIVGGVNAIVGGKCHCEG